LAESSAGKHNLLKMVHIKYIIYNKKGDGDNKASEV